MKITWQSKSPYSILCKRFYNMKNFPIPSFLGNSKEIGFKWLLIPIFLALACNWPETSDNKQSIPASPKPERLSLPFGVSVDYELEKILDTKQFNIIVQAIEKERGRGFPTDLPIHIGLMSPEDADDQSTIWMYQWENWKSVIIAQGIPWWMIYLNPQEIILVSGSVLSHELRHTHVDPTSIKKDLNIPIKPIDIGSWMVLHSIWSQDWFSISFSIKGKSQEKFWIGFMEEWFAVAFWELQSGEEGKKSLGAGPRYAAYWYWLEMKAKKNGISHDQLKALHKKSDWLKLLELLQLSAYDFLVASWELTSIWDKALTLPEEQRLTFIQAEVNKL